jgi:phosphoglycolate phosphatase
VHSSVRLVLFDIDGTLIHSGGAGEKAFAAVARDLFDIQDATRDLHFAGRTDPAIVRELFLKHGIEITPENFGKFFDGYVVRLQRLVVEITGRVLPGVESWIAQLQALPTPPLLGLLTGNIRRGAQIKLTHYGLWQHFPFGAFADDAENRCEIAATARDRGGRLLNRELRGEEILVIGDTRHDIECGQSIGARVLAVGTGMYQSEELRVYNPTWCVPSLDHFRPEDACR